MKKFLALTLIVSLALTLSAFAPASAEQKQLKIVTTIFPIYDWVREITGENAEADLTLLLDSGVDLHNYQPTVQDIVKISQCDLFIYVGGESDEWTEDVFASAQNQDLKTISLLEALGEDVKEEETVEGMEAEEEEEEGEPEADEHVWLSLRNAQKLVQAIADTLCEIDPANAETYQANAESYVQKLQVLDRQYADMVSAAAFKTMLFGDRFPFRYLADDYELAYYAAFSGCSAETEASFQTILFLAQKVDELKLPAVLTIENAKSRMPETIVASTAEKNQKILSLNSMQGTTARDVQAGVTYLSIMENNLSVLREALN